MDDIEVCGECWHEDCVCAVPVTDRILNQLNGNTGA